MTQVPPQKDPAADDSVAAGLVEAGPLPSLVHPNALRDASALPAGAFSRVGVAPRQPGRSRPDSLTC